MDGNTKAFENFQDSGMGDTAGEAPSQRETDFRRREGCYQPNPAGLWTREPVEPCEEAAHFLCSVHDPSLPFLRKARRRMDF